MTPRTMTEKQLFEFVKESLHPTLLNLLESKGKQYTGEEVARSAFSNFELPAGLMGIPTALYLLVQATKQWYVICQWAASGATQEGFRDREIRQRALDVIIYLYILLASNSLLAVGKEDRQS